MSRHYSSRIAHIPLPPSPPPQHLKDEYMHPMSPQGHYDYPKADDYYPHGVEDTARELDESMLGAPETAGLSKGKGKQVAKRPAPLDIHSDASSDLEVPVASRKDKFGHTIKRRRVEKDAVDMADELELPAAGEPFILSGKPVPSVKGKAKLGLLHEGSPDSTSTATPNKIKKKPGPKKKLDFPEGFGDYLGAGSGPASVSGDITPSASRAPSPTLTSTSNIVYELDDTIPPLKRAKKVDDHAMLKRVKTLEEQQRKVWTNIARRDIQKVRQIMCF